MFGRLDSLDKLDLLDLLDSLGSLDSRVTPLRESVVGCCRRTYPF